jgi:hypothetical protein
MQSYFSSWCPGWRAGKLPTIAHMWSHGGLLPVTAMEASSRPRHDAVWRGHGGGGEEGSRGARKLLMGKRCVRAIELFAGRGGGSARSTSVWDPSRRRSVKTPSYSPSPRVCSASVNGTLASPGVATRRASVGRGGGFLQISHSIDRMNYGYVIYRISNCAYSQMYKQLTSP